MNRKSQAIESGDFQCGRVFARSALLWWLACCFATPAAWSNSLSAARQEPPTLELIDVTGQWQLQGSYENGARGRKYMHETMGSGACLFDYDGDGQIDLYLVNGAVLDESPSPQMASNTLWRNIGNSFVNVTESAGVGDTEYGMGAVWGDIDNDGDEDLYVINFGTNRLFRNLGDGTFVDIAAESGVADASWGSHGVFADFNGDGWLDIYVVNYVDFTLDNHKYCGNPERQLRAYCHPDVFDGQKDRLYINQGGGNFSDATAQLHMSDEIWLKNGKGLGVSTLDFDDDGDVDIFVSNDSTTNFLFRNLGQGDFEEIGLFSGIAYNEQGQTEAGMGIAIGDPNGDGKADIFVTHLDLETNTFYVNQGMDFFADMTNAAGLAGPSRLLVGFGTFFFDLDRDGIVDLLVANGHIIDNISEFSSEVAYAQPNSYYWGVSPGKFRLIEAGEDWQLPTVSRTLLYADLDGDRQVEIIETRNTDAARVFKVQGVDGSRHWMRLSLLDSKTRRNDWGAHLRVICGQQSYSIAQLPSTSYQGQSEASHYVGLGTCEGPVELSIRWSDGTRLVIESAPVDTSLTILKP